MFFLFAACGRQTQAVIYPTSTSEVISEASTEVPATPALPEFTTSIPALPASTAAGEPCAFVEATQNLPEVSAQIDKAVKKMQPTAAGRAQTYGENCVDTSNSNSQSTFHAMETDFYFKINVKNLNDNNELGMWIIKVMKIIESVPAAALPGSQPGFADFTFKLNSNQRILHVPIDRFKSLPSNINPSDVIPTLIPGS